MKMNNITEIDSACEIPIAIKMGNEYKEDNNFKGVFNVSKGELVTVVSKDYTLIQHRDILENFKTALNNLNVPFELKLISANNKLVMDIEFPEMRKNVMVGEEFTLGFRVINSYNKSTSLIIAPKFVRLACANGMVVTAKNTGAFHIRHNSKLAEDIPAAIEKAINETIATSEKLSTWVSECMTDSVEWEHASKIVEKLIYQKKWKTKILDELGIRRVEIEENGIKKIKYVSADGKKINRWSIYNSITKLATHDTQLSSNVEAWLQQRATKLLTTPLQQMPIAVVQ